MIKKVRWFVYEYGPPALVIGAIVAYFAFFME